MMLSPLYAVCSAYVLPLKDIVDHLFGEQMFARYAGTRTQAMLDSPVFQKLDASHGQALSTLSSHRIGLNADVVAPSTDLGQIASSSRSSEAILDTGVSDSERVDPDPTDEVMTGEGDRIALLFALFIDGVQLHDHGRATTTVVGLKCLDLPGFLSNTDLASFPIAYIGGAKEPTDLSEFMKLILQQFKKHEPYGTASSEGGSANIHNTNFLMCSPGSLMCVWTDNRS